MQEKKLLRDALRAIIDYIESGKIDVWDSYGNLLEVAGMADKALASTTGETEMEKLREWLDEQCEAHFQEMKAEPIGNKGADQFHATRIAFNSIRDYITTQFREEEGDADRG